MSDENKLNEGTDAVPASDAEDMETASFGEEVYREYDLLEDGFLGVVPGEEDANKPKGFEFFRSCMEEKRILNNVMFTMQQTHTGLWFYEGEIKVMMPLNEVVDVNETTQSEIYVSKDHLKRSYSVIVYSVDEANSLVLVSFVRARNKLRPAKIAQIREALERGENPIVKARVYKLSEVTNDEGMSSRDLGRIRMAYLDIWGLGINGRLHERDFGDYYMPDLRHFVSLNDVLTVRIVKEGYMLHKGRRKVRFECSKKDAERSPWEFIKLAKGVNVRVKCITPGKGGGEVVRGSAMFEGAGAKITCHYVAKRNIRMEVGRSYTAVVTKFSREAKKLNVDIIEPCEFVREDRQWVN